jgi:hypothetical protein
MRPVARIMLAFALGRAVFGLLFLVSVLAHWPTLWYLALERRWVFARAVETVGMDWYGRSALSLLGGALAGAVTYAVCGRAPPSWGKGSVVVGLSRLGGTLLLFDVMFYTLTLLTRTIDPIAMPAWYCPR